MGKVKVASILSVSHHGFVDVLFENNKTATLYHKKIAVGESICTVVNIYSKNALMGTEKLEEEREKILFLINALAFSLVGEINKMNDSDKFERFFELTKKHLIAAEKIINKNLDSAAINSLGYLIVDILSEGYELSRKDHDTVAKLTENQLYRKGMICELDGLKFYHQSTSYVKVVEGDKEYDFSLKNLPDYEHLNKFGDSVLKFIGDCDVQSVMDHNRELRESSHLLKQFAEIIYWRKVAKSIARYHEEKNRDEEARSVLLKAGFSEDEVEGYIPSTDLID